MKIIALVVITFSLLTSFTANGKTIFYQPLSRDASLPMQDWYTLIDKLKDDGYTELVIQWGQYGSQHFMHSDDFLRKVIKYSSAKGFKFWIGLYMPDDYYQRLEIRHSQNVEYIEDILQKNRHLLGRYEIQDIVESSQLSGWYLPTELTHDYLASGVQKADIVALLKEFKSSITKPVAISYFMGENTTVKQGLKDIYQLTSLNYNVWFQSSNGLKKSTNARLLIDKLDCKTAIITENFFQTSSAQDDFTAKSANKQYLEELDTCHQNIVFSLRYLPNSTLPLEEPISSSN